MEYVYAAGWVDYLHRFKINYKEGCNKGIVDYWGKLDPICEQWLSRTSATWITTTDKTHFWVGFRDPKHAEMFKLAWG